MFIDLNNSQSLSAFQYFVADTLKGFPVILDVSSGTDYLVGTSGSTGLVPNSLGGWVTVGALVSAASSKPLSSILGL